MLFYLTDRVLNQIISHLLDSNEGDNATRANSSSSSLAKNFPPRMAIERRLTSPVTEFNLSPLKLCPCLDLSARTGRLAFPIFHGCVA